MLYGRGARQDFDNWSKSVGPAWSYKAMLPLFKDFETIAEDIPASEYRGTSGSLFVTTQAKSYYFQSMAERFLKAAQELNYTTGDYNGDKQTYFSNVQKYIKDGIRESVDNLFIRPCEKDAAKSRLHKLLFARVTKVVFKNPSKGSSLLPRATGLEFVYQNSKIKVKCSKEVILSTGALVSSQLLKLSGIGPRKQLEDLGIEVIAELDGVGLNLHDQPRIRLEITTNLEDAEEITPELYCEYKKTNGTILAGPTSFGIGFVGSSNLENDERCAFVELNMHDYRGRVKGGLLLNVIGVKPESRGSLHLATANPYDQPCIDLNYLKKKADKERLKEGLKIGLNMLETKPFKEINAKASLENMNHCNEAFADNLWSDAFLDCFVTYYTDPSHRFAGTCKMGADNDNMAVVDARLRVRKVRNLRVVDGSIQPTVVRGPPAVTNMIIGWKAGDILKEDHTVE